ncbi:transposase [Nocardioides sp. GCM10027113]|uniref:transposase n=1 Tax=unclassified Nocardioides TaxID=2615069 RepID=UPI00360E8443
MAVIVVTADQRGGRKGPDLVPAALETLAATPTLLPFERTAGDEVQGVLDDPASLPAVVELLLRAGHWHLGIGVGPVDEPLPDHARAGRGPAYLRAREAVDAAKTSPWNLRVVAGPDDTDARDLESLLWLLAALLHRRTDKGWEVVDLADEGLPYEEIARRVGVTQSAVSQRAQAAGLVEGRRAREVVARLAARLLGKDA